MSRYIDKDALKYYGNHIGDEYEDYFHETQWVYRSQIDSAPSIDIEPKRGEWVAVTKDNLSRWECSLCGKPALLDNNEQMELSKFCPNCGAKMKGADDDY